MIRCVNCKVIQKDGTATCTACGLPTSGVPQGQTGAATTGPVLPNQVPRGAPAAGTSGPVLPSQAGQGPGASAASPAGAPAAPGGQAPPSAPAYGTAPSNPTAPPFNPTPSAPPVAPARHPGPVVLGPASDPGVGGRGPGSFPGAGGPPATGPVPVVVGPPAKEGDSSKGLKIAAIIGSSLVLVLLVALVIVLAGRGSTVETGNATSTTTSTSSSTTTTIATTTTTAPIPADLNLAAYGRAYTTGEPVDVPVAFTGDPNAIATTELHLNGLPHESVNGLRTNFSVATPLPGTVRIKVVIKLKNGETRESNEVAATVSVPTTTAPPPPPPPPVTDPPRRSCYGCVVLRMYSGLSNVAVRDRPTRSSTEVYTVHSGSYLEGDCYVNGETVSHDGRTTDNWVRLADGNYIWDGFVATGFSQC